VKKDVKKVVKRRYLKLKSERKMGDDEGKKIVKGKIKKSNNEIVKRRYL
jgi:hypothetical protein